MSVIHFEMNDLGSKLILSILQFLSFIFEFSSVPVYEPNKKTDLITLLSYLIYKMQSNMP